MAKGKKKEVLTLEERLQAALVPESEQPYQVPGNWCWTRMQNIARWGSGGTPSRKIPEYYEGTIPWLKTGELNDDYIFETEEHITKDAIINSSAKLFPVNTVAIAMYGATIGKVCILGVKAATNQACACGIAYPEINFKYLFYYARSQKNAFINQGKGGAQPNISQEIIKSHPFPLSPLPEQSRIVDRIEGLFAKLDEARQKVQDVLDGFEPRRAAILHKAFSGELTAQWRKEHGVGMEEWIDTVLSKVVTGFKYGTSEKSDYSYAGMPVFRIPNITENGLSFEDMKFLPHYDVKEESQIHENDILIIRSNGSRDLVGKSVLVPKLDVSYAYASFLIKIKPSAAIVPDFLVLYLNSTGARVQMFKKAKSSVGINNINAKELGGIALKIPSIQEQSKVVHVLDDLFAKERQAKEAAETVLEQIDLIKKSILARAFRGELGTNDPAEESALELIKQTLSETIANNE